jgi:hypothetical protein
VVGASTRFCSPPEPHVGPTGLPPDAKADVASAAAAAPLSPSASQASPRAPAADLSPLDAAGPLIPLSVPSFRDAVVSVPLGATEPRPIVVALHGNFDRPEWQCEVWRGVTKGFPFVLCPRGIPRPDAPPPLDRWTYGKGTDVRREIDAALSALTARFGAHVAALPLVYAGFSLGAIVGVGIVSEAPSRFPRAVLTEGGHSAWTRERALGYARAGGRRVLFACGQPSCKIEAARPEKLLTQAGIEVRRVYGDERAHTYDGKVAQEIAAQWAWLVEDDPHWSGSRNR